MLASCKSWRYICQGVAFCHLCTQPVVFPVAFAAATRANIQHSDKQPVECDCSKVPFIIMFGDGGVPSQSGMVLLDNGSLMLQVLTD